MPQPLAEKPPTRRQLAAQQTRRKLLDAALANFTRRPYAEVTVGDIARTAGVAHGLLSHHFDGKESLYAEAVRETDRELRAATEIGSDGPVVERLRRHLRAHLAFLAEHEDAAVNLILRRTETSDVAGQAFESTRQEGIRAICGLLGLAADEPALQLPVRGFIAACDEMSLQWLRGGRALSVEALVEVYLSFLAGAVRAAHGLAPVPALSEALQTLGGGASRS
ncbi:TetR/AcrR family transcriptional regulator [Streptomyces sp. NBC_01716]|uniref:TetR/AcrR family transcriptional regulator n=1 Tax=Streptomyces sp. NBC_01716 TaxID=2975917 RepID=UPI002E3187C7|nr:TetR/AcrR family transcriptional regulator [Streptomyces sp. NBC_01716]